MSNKLWKECERHYARLFGGKRNPITGRIRTEGTADMEVSSGIFSWLSFEIKHRAKLPQWLFFDAFDQATKASKKEKKFSTVLLHQKGQKYEDSFVVMSVKDFIEYSNLISGNKENVEVKNEQ